jgi:hypothetical protein
MKIYNSVLDQITLVVGKNHLYEAIKIIPDWWGVMVAKNAEPEKTVTLCTIRKATQNPNQDNIAVAALLWRDEAISILEEKGKAQGVRSKARKIIYERLVEVMDERSLKAKVREYLCTRVNWRSELQYILNGD